MAGLANGECSHQARITTALVVACFTPRGASVEIGCLAGLAQSDGLRDHYTLTRERPAGWNGYGRRVDAEMLADVAPAPVDRPRTYVCGPTPFVESVADLLVGLGHPPHAIRAERFGPTGG